MSDILLSLDPLAAMARPLRTLSAGGWNHFVARGYNCNRLFWDDRDPLRFPALVSELLGRFGVEIHAYALALCRD